MTEQHTDPLDHLYTDPPEVPVEESEAGGKRDAVEGLLIGVAMRSLRLGVDVVLDFGVWTRDERTGLRHLAADVGSVTRLHYLSVEPEEQWRRLAARDDPRSFRIARAEMDGYATLFETPTVEGRGQVPVLAQWLADQYRAGGWADADIHVLPYDGNPGNHTAAPKPVTGVKLM